MRINWAYVAGFFDGEGSISFSRRNGGTSCTVVGLAQSQEHGKTGPPTVFVAISEFLRCRQIRHNVYEVGARETPTFVHERAVHTYRTVYHIQIQNRPGITAFLQGVYPYLYVKKQKAEDALRFLKLFPDMRGYFSNVRQAHLSVDALAADRAVGMTYAMIAKKHHCSVGCVHRKLNLENSRQQMRNWRARRISA